jgi:tetratricopeptide (TPR) repeat protein
MTLVAAAAAHAQFVYPKPSDNQQAISGTYAEDPFITKYRQRFFAALRGDFATFNKAYEEIETMTKKDPRDARALVWLGNGQTIKAIRMNLMGQQEAAAKLLADSRTNLDRAVALKPKDYNIYMMRSATLYAQGQYIANQPMPRENWEKIRDDCLSLIKSMGPKVKGASVHVKGETYGELGIAYLKLGEKAKAKAAFQKISELVPGTSYDERARKEIRELGN